VLATTGLTPTTTDNTTADHHHLSDAAIPPAPDPPLGGRNRAHPGYGSASPELNDAAKTSLSLRRRRLDSSATAPLRREARDFSLLYIFSSSGGLKNFGEACVWSPTPKIVPLVNEGHARGDQSYAALSG